MDFPSFLGEKLKERGLTLKRLSELTGISLNHLEKLSEGDWYGLPPSPYVRGYIKRISQFLDFDAEEWWPRLKEEGVIKTPSISDEPPKNRYRRPSKIPVKNIWLIAVFAAIILAYFGLRFSKIFGEPQVTVTYPTENPAVVQTDILTIKGAIAGGDKLLVNGEAVSFAQDGSWQKDVSLQPGLNTVQVTASKFLGRETTLVRQIIYEPPASASASSAPAAQ